MPRVVDHDARRDAIVRATLHVLATKGARGLSVRAVAERLGGSTTLVTHYFSNREEMINAVWISSRERWEQEVRKLDDISSDPRERLLNFLMWLLPLTDEGRMQERARINLLSGQFVGSDHSGAFRSWDVQMRSLLQARLEGLIADEDLLDAVDQLRVAANGVTLSALERPDAWNDERILSVMERQLVLLGIFERGEHFEGVAEVLAAV